MATEWREVHSDPPEQGQKIWYFGPNIGLHIGHYEYRENGIKRPDGTEIPLCPHLIKNVRFGLVDGCDAPHWIPYDAEMAEHWVPLPPRQYLRGLFDES